MDMQSRGNVVLVSDMQEICRNVESSIKKGNKENEQIVKAINDLYILNRSKYLEQGKQSYVTRNHNDGKNGEKKVPKLADWMLYEHLKGKKTVGIFAGEILSKFICFDVDTPKLPVSKQITYKLVNVLMEDYNIPQQYINVSFSGSKGYHVEIFIKDTIANEKLYDFYLNVMEHLEKDVLMQSIMYDPMFQGKGIQKIIEYRATFSMGMKLPLGIHKDTHARCYYCDTITLDLIKDMSHILSIKKMPKDEFIMLVFDNVPIVSLKEKDAEELHNIARTTNIIGKTARQVENDCIEILRENHLKFPNTRNRVTLLLSIFMYSQGWDLEDTIKRITEVMENTWQCSRSFFSETTNWEYIVKEIKRVSKNTYDKEYQLKSGRTEIRLFKSEILTVLNVKGLHLKKILFSMLIHSKRYAKRDKTFFMTAETISNMGNTDNFSRIGKYIGDLEKQGLVEVISRNKFNLALSIKKNKYIKHPNVYRLPFMIQEDEEEIKKIDEGYVTFNVSEEIRSFFDTVTFLIQEKEIKSILTKNEYYKQFKKYYQTV